MTTIIKTPVSEIREGDSLINPATGDTGWTAIENAEIRSDGDYVPEGEYARVKVRYPDGGTGYRHWVNPKMRILVEREDEGED